MMLAMSVKFCALKRGMEHEDRVEDSWERTRKMVSVCPTCYRNATSLLEGVVHVQSCLFRRQVTSAMPGCGGRSDGV